MKTFFFLTKHWLIL